MKLVLFYRLFSKISDTIIRFPLVVASSVGICIVTIYLTDHYNIVLKENFSIAILEKFLIVLILGFFLILSIDLYSERQKINSIYPTFPVLALLWIYFSSLPAGFDNFKNSDYVQFSLLLLTSVFLVMVAPFLSRGSQNGFWRYNKKLIRRFIFTILTMGILYIGLALSSQAAGYFLNPYLDLDLFDAEQGYFWIGISIASVIGVLLFLAGIPRYFDAHYNITNKPKDFLGLFKA